MPVKWRMPPSYIASSIAELKRYRLLQSCPDKSVDFLDGENSIPSMWELNMCTWASGIPQGMQLFKRQINAWPGYVFTNRSYEAGTWDWVSSSPPPLAFNLASGLALNYCIRTVDPQVHRWNIVNDSVSQKESTLHMSSSQAAPDVKCLERLLTKSLSLP